MFFVFDGMDGAGKTTQLNLFADWLGSQSLPVVTCSDPGTTGLGKQMRQLLLGQHQLNIHMRAEMLMFMTARAQLVEEVIRPALESQHCVVCDRYVFATVVYQGHAGFLDPEAVWAVNRVATDGLMADMTFILDADVETARQRLGESLDRMESRGLDYFQRVRDGFQIEAQRWPTGVYLIDAEREVDVIQEQIRTLASPILSKGGKQS